jgi:signal transduction histidine kinase/ActR/RegA family two-component response regulator
MRNSMAARSRAQFGRLVVSPFATIGVLAAVLVWEIEHVGSVVLSLAIALGGVVIGIVVARRLRGDMERLSEHYEELLDTADEQSRRAEEANRLKDQFLATLSHELRTPLNSILGWSRLLASGKLDAPQTARAIGAIERAGWTQSRLIEDLLDISQIAAGNLRIAPRPTQIEPLVREAVDGLRPAAAAKKLAVTVSFGAAPPRLTVDPDRFRQVVRSLVSNAIKFTPAGGAVEILVDVDGSDLRVVVRDTGVGFSSEVAAHMFERFRQGDASSTRAYGGLGLGLEIARHLLELHGGTISAHSGGPNAGSTFEARFPIRPDESAEPESERPTIDTPSLEGVSVLVVDDDPHALELARYALEQSGARVSTASSAHEARARFEDAPPDVIVSDVMMPDEDGLQLIRDIRAIGRRLGRDTPAAAVSALARTDDRRRALTAGFDMHAAKPIDPSELVVMVQRLARRNHGAAPSETIH